MEVSELKAALAFVDERLRALNAEKQALEAQLAKPDKGLYVFSMTGEVAILAADVARAESYLRHNIDIWDVFTLQSRQAHVGHRPPAEWNESSYVYGDHDADITWAQALDKYGVRK